MVERGGCEGRVVDGGGMVLVMMGVGRRGRVGVGGVVEV